MNAPEEEDNDRKAAAASDNFDTMSDEEKRKLLKPSITTEMAMEIMKSLYSSNPQNDEIKILTQLESYDDVNFKVSRNGTLYLLKIHNGVESDGFLRVYKQAACNYKQNMSSTIHLQTAMMDLLSTNNIPTSAPIPTATDGLPVGVQTLPVTSMAHGPRQLVVRLLSWVNGKLMSTVQLMPIETLADCGRLLGRVHAVLNRLDESSLQSIDILQGASQGMTRRASKLMIHQEVKEEMVVTDKIRQAQLWKIPESGLDSSLLIAARRYHQWDGKNTSGLRPFCKYIKDEKRRGMILSIIDAFEQSIINSGDSAEFRVGVNHGDFNDANILLNDDLTAMGVIDFGDSVESWRVLDVTVAMAYAMISTYGKANRAVSAAAAILRGYHLLNPLLPVEKKHLVLLVCCRLACSVTLGAYSYQQNPENEYLLFHAEPAWKVLEMIWCFNENQRAHMRAAFNRVLDQACLQAKSNSKVVNCSDLVCSDPVVEDLLSSVRLRTTFSDTAPPAAKKRRLSSQGLPIITFVTGNFKKLIELREILGIGVETQDNPLPFELNHEKVDLPELQGDAVEIAVQKCKLAAAKIGGAVITEDTSLCFNALGGLPGPYIKWFHDKCGHDGLNQMLSGFEDRSGYAQTVVCFCSGPNQEPAVFNGRTNGKIVPPRGPDNFGWDPIFEPVDGNTSKTYAEMTSTEKNAISHRSRALTQLREFLRARSHVLRDQMV